MNNDKKNIYQHYANCFQAFGFSLLGAQQLVMGKAPTSPTDKAMLKAYKDPSKSGAETQDYLVYPTPGKTTGNVDSKTGSVLSEEADSKHYNRPGFWDDEPYHDEADIKPGFWDD